MFKKPGMVSSWDQLQASLDCQNLKGQKNNGMRTLNTQILNHKYKKGLHLLKKKITSRKYISNIKYVNC